MRRLGRRDFSLPAQDLGRRLLGTLLIRRIGPVLRRARVVEVEAYLGPKDLASHASKGRTPRTEVMFGPPGHAYVYFIYGMHWMFNVVAGRTGEAHAVLVRAAEPLDGWEADLSGPARLARGFGITREDNGRNLADGELRFQQDPDYLPRITRTPRIGIDYARHWTRRLLRFVDLRSPLGARLR